MTKIINGPDGKPRCSWCAVTPEYMNYHDDEWGFPVGDDTRLFEKLCLESFQSGLSWRTILTKRENFRKAFKKFDINKMAKFTEEDVERLLNDKGIIRHRGKIEAVINNAKMAKELVKSHGSLAAFFWSFEPVVDKNRIPQVATTSDISIELAKTLKKKGWKFLGPTTIYAFLQAMGLINDHLIDCMSYKKVEQARKKFKRPT